VSKASLRRQDLKITQVYPGKVSGQEAIGWVIFFTGSSTAVLIDYSLKRAVSEVPLLGGSCPQSDKKFFTVECCFLNGALLALRFHAPLRLVRHNLRNGASRYVQEFADPNSMVGYTILVHYSSFPEERLELGETVFQIHANGVPEKTNPALADMTDQLSHAKI